MEFSSKLRAKAVRTAAKWRLRLAWETELIPCILCGNEGEFTP
jgi:hypothetical protein